MYEWNTVPTFSTLSEFVRQDSVPVAHHDHAFAGRFSRFRPKPSLPLGTLSASLPEMLSLAMERSCTQSTQVGPSHAAEGTEVS